MKYKISILAIALTFLGGCSDTWLNDIEPQGKLLEVNYYQTEDEIKKGLVSIYSMWKNQYWQGEWSGWYMYASMPSDDAVPHGGGTTDRAEFWAAHEFEITPITDGIKQLWDRSYFGIYRANVLLGRVDINASATNKIVVAEARMLRALFYFDLVKYFGEVPLIDHVLTPSEYDQAKVSKEEIFRFIAEDLKKAAADLPVSWTGEDKYRMTKYAALGLLGKVYTYMASPYYNIDAAYYDSAATQLKLVIDEGQYVLEEDYDMIWWYANEFNNETLIEMSYGYGSGISAPFFDGDSDSEGNVIQQLCGPRGINTNDTLTNGWGFDMVTQDLVNEYRLQGDSVRLHATTMAEWQFLEWGITTWEENEGYTGYYSKKRTTWKIPNPGGIEWGYNTNERILRLGDIILLYAEALSQTGNDPDAIDNVDILRTRAGLGSISDVMTDQGLDLYSAIKLERRLELAKEGERFFDLVRWGDAASVLGTQGFQAGKHEHMPIPQFEIDDSNGALIQNPSYQ